MKTDQSEPNVTPMTPVFVLLAVMAIVFGFGGMPGLGVTVAVITLLAWVAYKQMGSM